LPIATTDRFANPEQAAGQLTTGAAAPIEPLLPLNPQPSTEPTAVERATSPPAASPGRRPDADTTRVTAPPTVAVPAATLPSAVAVDLAVESGQPGADLALPPPPSRPVRVLVVGDSVAWSLGNGLVGWADAHPEYALVGQSIAVSCGFVRAGFVPSYYGLGYEPPCNEMLDVRLPEMIAGLQPDVVMLMSTRIDVETRLWRPDEDPMPSTNPLARERRLDEYRAFTQRVLDLGAPHVVWVKPPIARRGALPDQPMMDDATMASLHAAIDQVVVEFGPQVSSIDLAGWYPAGGFDDAAARPDGLHFEPGPAETVADRYLGPALVRVALGSPV
jgi:hypothetical protein